MHFPKNNFSNWMLMLFSLVVMLLIAEGVVRLLGHVDADGNFYFHGKKIRPYRIPQKYIQMVLNRYQHSDYLAQSHIMYDPFLGWSPRPAAKSGDGLYIYDRHGIRSAAADAQVSTTKPTGVVRIALFGDSFIHGDDVPFSGSFGYYLEQDLRKNGLDAEVLNFGVPGYGMDQAWIRWERSGKQFEPDIVIFGLVLEDMCRNVNLFRPFYVEQTGIIFFKPRYIHDDGDLKLINSPTPRPEEIAGIVADIGSWPLIRHEHWFDYHDYQDNIFLKSRFCAVMRDVFSQKVSERPLKNYPAGSDIRHLSFDIVKAFGESVRETGAEFYILYLPTFSDVMQFVKYHYTADDLLLEFRQSGTLIDTRNHFGQAITKEGLDKIFLPHYSSLGNHIIADEASRFLLKESRHAKMPPIP